MPNTIAENPEIERELAELSLSPIQQLRQRWRAVFRTDPPAVFGPDLLRRSIAQRIQEQHYGGLSASVQKELNHRSRSEADISLLAACQRDRCPAAVRPIILRSNAPELSNNIIQKRLAFGRRRSGTVANPGR